MSVEVANRHVSSLNVGCEMGEAVAVGNNVECRKVLGTEKTYCANDYCLTGCASVGDAGKSSNWSNRTSKQVTSLFVEIRPGLAITDLSHACGVTAGDSCK